MGIETSARVEHKPHPAYPVPKTKPYKLLTGMHNGKEPGSICELTESQAIAFADKFAAVGVDAPEHVPESGDPAATMAPEPEPEPEPEPSTE